MFLIEYDTGVYINAEEITWMDVSKGMVLFRISSDSKRFDVSEDYNEHFLSQLKYLDLNKHAELNKTL
tara:strand:- start:271 stop:474 length:204 start_codon:yes stop_codon:yes gene_type:complete